MDIRQALGGDTDFFLSDKDIQCIKSVGFIIEYSGLNGPESRTTVSRHAAIKSPLAEIDAVNNLTVYIGKDTKLPLEIPNDRIYGIRDEHDKKKTTYFGEAGKIVLHAVVVI